MYKIYARDSKLNKVGEIDDFEKLELNPRFNAVGTFVLDMDARANIAWNLIQNQAGIIVQKDGITIFSGNVTSRERHFSNNGDVISFSGKDDNLFLYRFLAWPETNGNFSTQAYDVRTGPAETVMKNYVKYNAGPNAASGRNFLTIQTDTALGTTVTGRARFDNLVDLLASLAVQGGGLGFKVLQVGSALQFQVYQPQDKTGTAIFSPLLGNVSDFTYKLDNPESNLVIVGGGGVGASRTLNWEADNSSIVKYGRIETFVDQRDTTDPTELQKAMDEEIANKAEKYSFSFTPIDTPELTFNTDYGLGDKVSVILQQPGGSGAVDTIEDIVREVKITLDPNGETINPVIGSQSSNDGSVIGIFTKMKKMNKRISNLERV